MSLTTPMDITSIDSSSDTNAGDNNTFLKGARSKIDGELTHDSVEDLVKKVIKKLGKNGCIRTLDIVGHGGSGILVVGGRRTAGIKGKQINGDKKDWEDELKKLKKRFCKKGKLRLLGCSVGVCDKGASKLQQVADVVGVPVSGASRDLTSDDYGSKGFKGSSKDLIEVKPGDKVTKCLVKTDGTRVKKLKKLKKPKQLKTGNAGVVNPNGIQRIGIRSQGFITGTSLIHPIDDRVVIDALIDLIDFEEAYDGSEVASVVESQISVMYGSGLVESWNIIFEGQGVELARGGRSVVFASRDAQAVNAFVTELTEIQIASDQLYRDVFGLSTSRARRHPGPAKVLRAEIINLVDKPFRELSASGILDLPITAIKGVGEIRAKALKETLDVSTVSELAELGPRTKWGAIAVMIQELAEFDQ